MSAFTEFGWSVRLKPIKSTPGWYMAYIVDADGNAIAQTQVRSAEDALTLAREYAEKQKEGNDVDS